MDWFKSWINKIVERNLGKFLSIPPAIAGFLMVIIKALQDGKIDDKELHLIVEAGLGANLLFVIPVLLYVYFNRNKKIDENK